MALSRRLLVYLRGRVRGRLWAATACSAKHISGNCRSSGAPAPLRKPLNVTIKLPFGGASADVAGGPASALPEAGTRRVGGVTVSHPEAAWLPVVVWGAALNLVYIGIL